MQSVEEFWAEVRQRRDEIKTTIAKQKNQPDDGTVYITSLRNRDRGTQAGDITLASIKLAGQRIAEGTHVISTDEEIEKHLERHAKRAEEINRMEIKRKQTYFVTGVGESPSVNPPHPPVKSVSK